MAQPFERDLGYLDRFLEKVKTHAAELSDRAGGERLATLIDEEVARWAEIRGLLAGEAAGPPGDELSGDEADGEEADGEEADGSVERGPTAQRAAGAEEGAGSGAPPADEAHTPASGPSPDDVPDLLAPEAGRETPVGPTSWEPRRRLRRRAAGSAETREAHQGRRWTVGPLRPRS